MHVPIGLLAKNAREPVCNSLHHFPSCYALFLSGGPHVLRKLDTNRRIGSTSEPHPPQVGDVAHERLKEPKVVCVATSRNVECAKLLETL